MGAPARSEASVRVVAGRWRGRRLTAPTGELVRPTTDRVKEALFSILGDAVQGALVLDLCCGSGSLGIEALSRGAGRAVFVDREQRALAAVRKNLAACGAMPADAEVVVGHAVAWLSGPGFSPGGVPWLLLADPPYGRGLAAGIAEVLVRPEREYSYSARQAGGQTTVATLNRKRVRDRAVTLKRVCKPDRR